MPGLKQKLSTEIAMNPRHACLACLERTPPALFEAGLWVAAEHDAKVDPAQVMRGPVSYTHLTLPTILLV